jgi:hypothetical protein
MSWKGKFKPVNIQKYKGDHTNITYRSSWELTYFSRLDKDPDVISWSSEETIIPYVSPLDGQVHRYFPDVLVTRKTPNGVITEMIEIKPHAQTQPPKVKTTALTKTSGRKYLKECATYAVNQAKWHAAKKYCEKRGYTFLVMTEKDLKVF